MRLWVRADVVGLWSIVLGVQVLMFCFVVTAFVQRVMALSLAWCLLVLGLSICGQIGHASRTRTSLRRWIKAKAQEAHSRHTTGKVQARSMRHSGTRRPIFGTLRTHNRHTTNTQGRVPPYMAFEFKVEEFRLNRFRFLGVHDNGFRASYFRLHQL